MEKKSLKEISWLVSEETYREDPALSYSTLATFERGGFNILPTLYDKKESSSLTFGSAVDALITGGQEEFDSKFIVADFPEIPEAIIKVVKDAFGIYGGDHRELTDIPDNHLLTIIDRLEYQKNWKPETRVKVIKEKGAEYYSLLYLAEDKTILSNDVYLEVLASVRALKESESTKFYFQADDPFDDSIERLYQLKFKATLNGVDYRCMADEIIVDHNKKIIYPKDLKTSSHLEWEFFKSFIQWNYQIQARLYWRIIRANLDADPYFKDFTLADYEFIVVNKVSLIPLVWLFPATTAVGTLFVGKDSSIELRDPEEIGKELAGYLATQPTVPNGINLNSSNNLIEWLKTYE